MGVSVVNFAKRKDDCYALSKMESGLSGSSSNHAVKEELKDPRRRVQTYGIQNYANLRTR
jgi:hypothetical protein